MINGQTNIKLAI